MEGIWLITVGVPRVVSMWKRDEILDRRIVLRIMDKRRRLYCRLSLEIGKSTELGVVSSFNVYLKTDREPKHAVQTEDQNREPEFTLFLSGRLCGLQIAAAAQFFVNVP